MDPSIDPTPGGPLPIESDAPTEMFDDKSRYLDRFGLLLILVSATIVLASLVRIPHESSVVTKLGVMLLSVLGSAYLLLAIHASGVSRRPRRIAEVAIGVLLAIQLGGGVFTLLHNTGAAQDARVPPLLALLFAILAFTLVIRRVLQHREVSAATLKGAITGYLLIPVAFFNLFLSMEILMPGGFFGETSETSPEFMYFSLTTLTTLGSPLEAGTALGRLMTAIESVVGQLYLVVFVALIVGLLAGRWASIRSEQDEG